MNYLRKMLLSKHRKKKFSTVETVQPLTDRNVSSGASAGSLHAAESYGSRECQPSSSSLSKYVTKEEVRTAEILWSMSDRSVRNGSGEKHPI